MTGQRGARSLRGQVLLLVILMLGGCAGTSPAVSGRSPSAADDLGLIVFSRRSGPDNSDFKGLFAVAPEGGTAAPFLGRLAGDGAHFESIGFALDGSKVALAVVTPRFVGTAVANRDGSAYRILESDGALALVCDQWSPDGLRLVCTGIGDAPRAGLYTVDADDGAVVLRLTDIPNELEATHADLPCGFSPDGTQVAFVRIDMGHGNLYVVDSDGSDERLISSLGLDYGCDWSPDGDAIVGAGGGGDLYLIGLDGTESMIPLPNDIVNAFAPSFSPSGSAVVFSGWRDADGQSDIYTVDVDGSNVRQLTDTPSDKEEMAVWSR